MIVKNGCETDGSIFGTRVDGLEDKLSKLSPTGANTKYLQISTQVFVLLLSLLHTTLSDPNTFNLPHDAVDFRWVYCR